MKIQPDFAHRRRVFLVDRAKFASNKANDLTLNQHCICLTESHGTTVMSNSACDLRFRFRVGSIRLLSECAIAIYSGPA